jgi:outer membrane protein assembly factor BamB
MPSAIPGVVTLLLLASVAAQDDAPRADWPEYRGPTCDGQAPDAAVPLKWSEKSNVRWKTAIAGTGWSSPIVHDGRIWLTTATEDGKRRWAIAVDAASGKILHERVVFEVAEPQHKNALNSFASPSPVADAGRVWVHFGSDGTACLDAQSGATIWERRDLNCDHMEGAGSSPFLFDDLLVCNVDGGDVQYVVALDRETGETRWRTDRDPKLAELAPDLRKAYSTPIAIEVDGAPRLISSGARATVAYDPTNGKELWKVRHIGFSMSPRPLFHAGLVILSTGFMSAQLMGVRAAGEGDVTDTHVAWTWRRNVPKMPSPVLVDGRLYMVSDNGIVTCLEARTGQSLWHERIGGEHCASPLAAAGRIYFFDREGRTLVIAPGEKCRELAENRLADGFMASPAVTGDALILRTTKALYRIEGE